MTKRMDSFKSIRLFLAVAFFFSNFDIDSKSFAQAQSVSVKDFPFLNPGQSGLVLPEKLGQIRESWIAPGADAKTVYLIQDAHANDEVQWRMASIIDWITRGRKDEDSKVPLLIGVEGSSGRVDYSFFKSFPNEKLKKDLCDFYLRHGKITGPEFYAITSPKSPELFGIETPLLYLKNKKLFLDALKIKEEMLPRLDASLETLREKWMKTQAFQIYEILSLKDQYIRNTIGIYDYAMKLSGLKSKSLKSAGPHFQRALHYAEMEGEIRFSVLEDEEKQMLDILGEKLSRPDLLRLVQISLLYRSGQLSINEYYSALKSFAKLGKLDLSDFPNIDRCMKASRNRQDIDEKKLEDELADVEASFKHEFLKDKKLEQLWSVTAMLFALKRMAEMRGSEKDISVVLDVTGQMGWDGLGEILGRDIQLLKKNWPLYESYYQCIKSRDGEMIRNFFSEFMASPSKEAVLMVGGYHTPGLKEAFRKQKISYRIINPVIPPDSIERSYKLYLSRISAPETALDPEDLKLLSPVTGNESPAAGHPSPVNKNKTHSSVTGDSATLPADTWRPETGDRNSMHQGSLLGFVSTNKNYKAKVEGDFRLDFALLAAVLFYEKGVQDEALTQKFLDWMQSVKRDRPDLGQEMEHMSSGLKVFEQEIDGVKFLFGFIEGQGMVYRFRPYEANSRIGALDNTDVVARGVVGHHFVEVLTIDGLRTILGDGRVNSILQKEGITAIPERPFMQVSGPVEIPAASVLSSETVTMTQTQVPGAVSITQPRAGLYSGETSSSISASFTVAGAGVTTVSSAASVLSMSESGLGKGVLGFVYPLAERIARGVERLAGFFGRPVQFSRNQIEDYFAPMVEEPLVLGVGLCLSPILGGFAWAYLAARAGFVIWHVLQKQEIERTFFQKIALPFAMSAVAVAAAFIPMITSISVPLWAVFLSGLGAHMVLNRFVTITGSNLQKGVLAGSGDEKINLLLAQARSQRDPLEAHRLYREAAGLAEVAAIEAHFDEGVLSRFQAIHREIEALRAAHPETFSEEDRAPVQLVLRAYNRPENFQALLGSIAEHQRLYRYGKEVKIIVMDDSTDLDAVRSHQEIAKQFREQGLEIVYYGAQEQLDLIRQQNASHGVAYFLGKTPEDFTSVETFMRKGKGYHGSANMAQWIAWIEFGKEKRKASDLQSKIAQGKATPKDIQEYRRCNGRVITVMLEDDIQMGTWVSTQNGERSGRMAVNYFDRLNQTFSHPEVKLISTTVTRYGDSVLNKLEMVTRSLLQSVSNTRAGRGNQQLQTIKQDIENLLRGKTDAALTLYHPSIDEKASSVSLTLQRPNLQTSLVMLGGNLALSEEALASSIPRFDLPRGEDAFFGFLCDYVKFQGTGGYVSTDAFPVIHTRASASRIRWAEEIRNAIEGSIMALVIQARIQIAQRKTHPRNPEEAQALFLKVLETIRLREINMLMIGVPKVLEDISRGLDVLLQIRSLLQEQFGTAQNGDERDAIAEIQKLLDEFLSQFSPRILEALAVSSSEEVQALKEKLGSVPEKEPLAQKMSALAADPGSQTLKREVVSLLALDQIQRGMPERILKNLNDMKTASKGMKDWERVMKGIAPAPAVVQPIFTREQVVWRLARMFSAQQILEVRSAFSQDHALVSLSEGEVMKRVRRMLDAAGVSDLRERENILASAQERSREIERLKEVMAFMTAEPVRAAAMGQTQDRVVFHPEEGGGKFYRAGEVLEEADGPAQAKTLRLSWPGVLEKLRQYGSPWMLPEELGDVGFSFFTDRIAQTEQGEITLHDAVLENEKLANNSDFIMYLLFHEAVHQQNNLYGVQGEIVTSTLELEFFLQLPQEVQKNIRDGFTIFAETFVSSFAVSRAPSAAVIAMRFVSYANFLGGLSSAETKPSRAEMIRMVLSRLSEANSPYARDVAELQAQNPQALSPENLEASIKALEGTLTTREISDAVSKALSPATKKAPGDKNVTQQETQDILRDVIAPAPKRLLGGGEVWDQEIAALLEGASDLPEREGLSLRVLRAVMGVRNTAGAWEKKSIELAEPVEMGEGQEKKTYTEAVIEVGLVDLGSDVFGFPRSGQQPLSALTVRETGSDGKLHITVYIPKALIDRNARFGASVITHEVSEAIGYIHPKSGKRSSITHLEANQLEGLFNSDAKEVQAAREGQPVLSDLSRLIIEEALRRGRPEDIAYVQRLLEPYDLSDENKNLLQNGILPKSAADRALALSPMTARFAAKQMALYFARKASEPGLQETERNTYLRNANEALTKALALSFAQEPAIIRYALDSEKEEIERTYRSLQSVFTRVYKNLVENSQSSSHEVLGKSLDQMDLLIEIATKTHSKVSTWKQDQLQLKELGKYLQADSPISSVLAQVQRWHPRIHAQRFVERMITEESLSRAPPDVMHQESLARLEEVENFDMKVIRENQSEEGSVFKMVLHFLLHRAGEIGPDGKPLQFAILGKGNVRISALNAVSYDLGDIAKALHIELAKKHQRKDTAPVGAKMAMIAPEGIQKAIQEDFARLFVPRARSEIQKKREELASIGTHPELVAAYDKALVYLDHFPEILTSAASQEINPLYRNLYRLLKEGNEEAYQEALRGEMVRVLSGGETGGESFSSFEDLEQRINALYERGAAASEEVQANILLWNLALRKEQYQGLQKLTEVPEKLKRAHLIIGLLPTLVQSSKGSWPAGRSRSPNPTRPSRLPAGGEDPVRLALRKEIEERIGAESLADSVALKWFLHLKAGNSVSSLRDLYEESWGNSKEQWLDILEVLSPLIDELLALADRKQVPTLVEYYVRELEGSVVVPMVERAQDIEEFRAFRPQASLSIEALGKASFPSKIYESENRREVGTVPDPGHLAGRMQQRADFLFYRLRVEAGVDPAEYRARVMRYFFNENPALKEQSDLVEQFFVQIETVWKSNPKATASVVTRELKNNFKGRNTPQLHASMAGFLRENFKNRKTLWKNYLAAKRVSVRKIYHDPRHSDFVTYDYFPTMVQQVMKGELKRFIRIFKDGRIFDIPAVSTKKGDEHWTAFQVSKGQWYGIHADFDSFQSLDMTLRELGILPENDSHLYRAHESVRTIIAEAVASGENDAQQICEKITRMTQTTIVSLNPHHLTGAALERLRMRLGKYFDDYVTPKALEESGALSVSNLLWAGLTTADPDIGSLIQQLVAIETLASSDRAAASTRLDQFMQSGTLRKISEKMARVIREKAIQDLKIPMSHMIIQEQIKLSWGERMFTGRKARVGATVAFGKLNGVNADSVKAVADALASFVEDGKFLSYRKEGAEFTRDAILTLKGGVLNLDKGGGRTPRGSRISHVAGKRAGVEAALEASLLEIGVWAKEIFIGTGAESLLESDLSKIAELIYLASNAPQSKIPGERAVRAIQTNIPVFQNPELAKKLWELLAARWYMRYSGAFANRAPPQGVNNILTDLRARTDAKTPFGQNTLQNGWDNVLSNAGFTVSAGRRTRMSFPPSGGGALGVLVLLISNFLPSLSKPAHAMKNAFNQAAEASQFLTFLNSILDSVGWVGLFSGIFFVGTAGFLIVNWIKHRLSARIQEPQVQIKGGEANELIGLLQMVYFQKRSNATPVEIQKAESELLKKVAGFHDQNLTAHFIHVLRDKEGERYLRSAEVLRKFFRAHRLLFASHDPSFVVMGRLHSYFPLHFQDHPEFRQVILFKPTLIYCSEDQERADTYGGFSIPGINEEVYVALKEEMGEELSPESQDWYGIIAAHEVQHKLNQLSGVQIVIGSAEDEYTAFLSELATYADARPAVIADIFEHRLTEPALFRRGVEEKKRGRQTQFMDPYVGAFRAIYQHFARAANVEFPDNRFLQASLDEQRQILRNFSAQLLQNLTPLDIRDHARELLRKFYEKKFGSSRAIPVFFTQPPFIVQDVIFHSGPFPLQTSLGQAKDLEKSGHLGESVSCYLEALEADLSSEPAFAGFLRTLNRYAQEHEKSRNDEDKRRIREALQDLISHFLKVIHQGRVGNRNLAQKFYLALTANAPILRDVYIFYLRERHGRVLKISSKDKKYAELISLERDVIAAEGAMTARLQRVREDQTLQILQVLRTAVTQEKQEITQDEWETLQEAKSVFENASTLSGDDQIEKYEEAVSSLEKVLITPYLQETVFELVMHWLVILNQARQSALDKGDRTQAGEIERIERRIYVSSTIGIPKPSGVDGGVIYQDIRFSHHARNEIRLVYGDLQDFENMIEQAMSLLAQPETAQEGLAILRNVLENLGGRLPSADRVPSLYELSALRVAQTILDQIPNAEALKINRDISIFAQKVRISRSKIKKWTGEVLALLLDLKDENNLLRPIPFLNQGQIQAADQEFIFGENGVLQRLSQRLDDPAPAPVEKLFLINTFSMLLAEYREGSTAIAKDSKFSSAAFQFNMKLTDTIKALSVHLSRDPLTFFDNLNDAATATANPSDNMQVVRVCLITINAFEVQPRGISEAMFNALAGLQTAAFSSDDPFQTAQAYVLSIRVLAEVGQKGLRAAVFGDQLTPEAILDDDVDEIAKQIESLMARAEEQIDSQVQLLLYQQAMEAVLSLRDTIHQFRAGLPSDTNIEERVSEEISKVVKVLEDAIPAWERARMSTIAARLHQEQMILELAQVILKADSRNTAALNAFANAMNALVADLTVPENQTQLPSETASLAFQFAQTAFAQWDSLGISSENVPNLISSVRTQLSKISGRYASAVAVSASSLGGHVQTVQTRTLAWLKKYSEYILWAPLEEVAFKSRQFPSAGSLLGSRLPIFFLSLFPALSRIFWPLAIVTSIVFGILHWKRGESTGENLKKVGATFVAGMVFNAVLFYVPGQLGLAVGPTASVIGLALAILTHSAWNAVMFILGAKSWVATITEVPDLALELRPIVEKASSADESVYLEKETLLRAWIKKYRSVPQERRGVLQKQILAMTQDNAGFVTRLFALGDSDNPLTAEAIHPLLAAIDSRFDQNAKTLFNFVIVKDRSKEDAPVEFRQAEVEKLSELSQDELFLAAQALKAMADSLPDHKMKVYDIASRIARRKLSEDAFILFDRGGKDGTWRIHAIQTFSDEGEIRRFSSLAKTHTLENGKSISMASTQIMAYTLADARAAGKRVCITHSLPRRVIERGIGKGDVGEHVFVNEDKIERFIAFHAQAVAYQLQEGAASNVPGAREILTRVSMRPMTLKKSVILLDPAAEQMLERAA